MSQLPSREDILEVLPGLIEEQNAERGTGQTAVPDFVLAARLGAKIQALRNLLEPMAAEGLVRLQPRRTAQDWEFNFVSIPEPGAADGDRVPPTYTGAPVESDELLAAMPVLDALEDIEERLINAGIYETFVEPEFLAGHLGCQLTPVLNALATLERDFLVFWPHPGKQVVRSRISEICRLLKLVKQRFKPGDQDAAPYLVRSLRVFFRSRRRPQRVSSLAPLLDRIAVEFEGRQPDIASTARAISSGIGEALAADPVMLTKVQADAVEAVGRAYLNRGRGPGTDTSFVISGDTGSGKTEAFALPLILGALQDARLGIEGTKVILAYPRIRLATNQAERLADYLSRISRAAGVPLSLGVQTKDTPQNREDLVRSVDGTRTSATPPFRDFRCPSCNAHLRIDPDATAGRHRLVCSAPNCDWSYGHYVATREGLELHPPDFLITTTESLHRWLTEPKWARVFGLGPAARGSCPPRAIVLDEIHLYNTIHGAQVTRLLQRLRHRIENSMKLWAASADGLSWRTPLLIGMSATIGEPADFWRRFSRPKVKVLAPAEDDYEAAAGRDYYIFIRPESESRGRKLSVASASIQSLMLLMHNMWKRKRGDSPKHRGLVFVESIDDLKRIHHDFRDAEEVKELWQLRLPRPPRPGDPSTVGDPPASEFDGFEDGEAWYFDSQDRFQFAQRRQEPGGPPAPLVVAPTPVYSQIRDVDAALSSDLVFATTTLEVGFDDPSLQLVFQYRAPRNPASFVQKKGRGGREFGDRSIMAAVLSADSYLDAFYYQSPQLLVEPKDYRPAINEHNYFVQRAHAVCAALDVAAFQRALSGSAAGYHNLTSRWYIADPQLLRPVLREDLLGARAEVDQAFLAVTTGPFRKRQPQARPLLTDFVESIGGREARWVGDRSEMTPANLFGSINLPLLDVTRADESNAEPMDVNLAAGEIPPGNVTRRFGLNDLFWLVPRPLDGAVAFVSERSPQDHGFDRSRVVDLPREIPGVEGRIPNAMRRLYKDNPPLDFFRPQTLFLARFGKYTQRGKPPQILWWYCPDCDRLGKKREPCKGCGEELAQLMPRTSGYLLRFPFVARNTPPYETLPAPRPLNTLFADIEVFAGFRQEDEGSSYLRAFEVLYGSEVTYRYRKGLFGQTQLQTRMYTLRSPQGAGAQPLLYGFDVHAEGICATLDSTRFPGQVASALERLEPTALGWLRRARLVYRVLSDAPVECGDPFFRGRLAEFTATATALAANSGEVWRDGVRRAAAIDAAARYWLHAQRFGPEDLGAFRTQLGRPDFVDFVATILESPDLAEFALDLCAHGLEHALRTMFTVIGGVAEQEVSGVVELRAMGTGAPSAVYVYEKGEWGNGATRLVRDMLADEGADRHLWRYIWGHCATCPVADEEDFVRWLLRERLDILLAARDALSERAQSAQAAEIPREWVERAVGRPYEVKSHISALARLVMGRESLAGQEFAHLDLYREVDLVARAVEEAFGRRPTAVELTNACLDHARRDPAMTPALARFLALVAEAAEEPEEEEESAPDYLEIETRRGNSAETRFVTSIERFSLSSCIDGCPACLAGWCSLGHPSQTRNLVSRRLLREVLLSAVEALAVDLDEFSAGTPLLEAAAARPGEGWLFVKSRDYQRVLAARQTLLPDYSMFDEIVEYAAGRTLAVFVPSGA